MLLGALPINLFIHFCCKTKMCRSGTARTVHSVRDRWTDRQTDSIIMPMSDQYDCLIKMTQTNKNYFPRVRLFKKI